MFNWNKKKSDQLSNKSFVFLVQVIVGEIDMIFSQIYVNMCKNVEKDLTSNPATIFWPVW